MIYLSKGGGGPVPIRTVRGSAPVLKVISNIYIALLCFMLKSVINSIEIDKSLIDVFCY